MPLLIALAVLILVVIWISRGNRKTVDSLDSSAELQLLRMCLGDREQMERLIALEQRVGQGITRLEGARRAVLSMRRDAG